MISIDRRVFESNAEIESYIQKMLDTLDAAPQDNDAQRISIQLTKAVFPDFLRICYEEGKRGTKVPPLLTAVEALSLNMLEGIIRSSVDKSRQDELVERMMKGMKDRTPCCTE